MKKASICLRVIAIAAACAGAAHAGAFDTIYDDQDIAALRPRYERGWHDNYDNVFSKAFTDQERSRHLRSRTPTTLEWRRRAVCQSQKSPLWFNGGLRRQKIAKPIDQEAFSRFPRERQ
jgi:hypothetical protein